MKKIKNVVVTEEALNRERIAARVFARELSKEEFSKVSGGMTNWGTEPWACDPPIAEY
jgi:hypothetical protein